MISFLESSLSLLLRTAHLIIFKLTFIVNSIAPDDPGVSYQSVFSELSFNNGVSAAISGLTNNQPADSVSLSPVELAYVVPNMARFDIAEFESLVGSGVGRAVVLLEWERFALLQLLPFFKSRGSRTIGCTFQEFWSLFQVLHGRFFYVQALRPVLTRERESPNVSHVVGAICFDIALIFRYRYKVRFCQVLLDHFFPICKTTNTG